MAMGKTVSNKLSESNLSKEGGDLVKADVNCSSLTFEEYVLLEESV